MGRKNRKNKKKKNITEKEIRSANNTMLKVGGALFIALILLLILGQFL